MDWRPKETLKPAEQVTLQALLVGADKIFLEVGRVAHEVVH